MAEQQSQREILSASTLIAGRYRVLSELGRGGNGTVYLAEHTTLKKEVALKVAQAASGDTITEEQLQRFQIEARAAASINHPNVVKVHDLGVTDDGQLFLAMDYAKGRSLSAELLANGPLREDEAVDLFIQVCAAVAAAHDKKILHRDLKPSNIIVERGANNKLIPHIVDFGLAKTADSANPDESAKVTRTGEIVGSPAYMSPQQSMGYQLDARTDIYSLGCVMYEALTGHVPFTGENAMQVLMKHVNERPPLFKSVAPNLTIKPELERIVMQALEKEPDNRYQSADDLLTDLKLVRQGKNPTKEASKRRKFLKAMRKVSRAGLLVIVPVAVFMIVPFVQFALEPKWQKDLNAANQQAVIRNHDDALFLLNRAIKEAPIENATKHEQAELYYRLGQLTWDSEPARSNGAFFKAVELLQGTAPDALQCWIQDGIAGNYIQLEQYDNALPYALKALEMKRKLFEPNSQFIVNSLEKLGVIYKQQKRWDDALVALKECRKIERVLYPNKDHPYIADVERKIFHIYCAEDDYDHALATGRSALELAANTSGKDSLAYANLAAELDTYIKQHEKQIPGPTKENGSENSLPNKK